MHADPPGTREAIGSGDLSVTKSDITMHLSCCCTGPQRQAVELVVVYGLTIDQAAKLLKRNKGTVYKQVQAFRRKVRKCEKGAQ